MGFIDEIKRLARPYEDEDEDEGKTATFPFLNKLFGAAQQRIRVIERIDGGIRLMMR